MPSNSLTRLHALRCAALLLAGCWLQIKDEFALSSDEEDDE
jgi:hypothetical protein